ncbi:MAG: hypothetical protein II776_05045 [Clostridia bacterium]|nr:hypothetical protein [Clostridia bacterium]
MPQDPRISRDPRQRRDRAARPPMTREEAARRAAARREAERRRAEAEARAKAEKARQKRIRRFRRRRLFALSFILSLFIVIGYFVILFATVGRADKPRGAYPVQVFRAGEKKAAVTLSVEETSVNGTTYLPVTVLSEFVTITQYGDQDTRSIGLAGGDWISFDLNTADCVVNGEHASLEAKVFMKGDVLYLPADFFFRKMNCFEYTYSSALSANVLTFLDGVTPALNGRTMTRTGRIDPASVPTAAV